MGMTTYVVRPQRPEAARCKKIVRGCESFIHMDDMPELAKKNIALLMMLPVPQATHGGMFHGRKAVKGVGSVTGSNGKVEEYRTRVRDDE